MSDKHLVKQIISLCEKMRGIHLPETIGIILTSALVGINTGLAAVLLNWLIRKINYFSYSLSASYLHRIAPFHYILILGIGGLLTGLIIHFTTTEIKGGGIPEIMEAVALRGGRIHPGVAIAKTLATATCIGTGGSAGSEGPIAQIGASIGSSVGQFFRLPEKRIRTLVACGAGAGTAAAFNAPIAGSIFAIEIILDNISSVNFSAIVIASVVASTIARLLKGNSFFFNIPTYTTTQPLELVLFAILGILAALFAWAFCRLRYFVEDIFDKLPGPKVLLPAIGCIMVGIIGIFTYKLNGIPRVFGIGYETINESLTLGMTLKMSFVLLLTKILTTSLTVGAGNSGGIFAPSLFMGAMLGQCYGIIANLIFPEFTAPASAYALVGMAAFFSGAVRAPITSILIIFEMTGNYHLILPLMLTTVASSLFSKWLSEDTIYTTKLSRKGINLKNIRSSANQSDQ